jgi:carboxypeptidase family protein
MGFRLDGKRTKQPARSRKLGFRARLAFLLTGMLASMALLWGCSGIVSGKPAITPPPPQTYSISGTVSPITGGSGTTVMLSGPTSVTHTTDSSGNYTFTGLSNGTYAVTPSHTGYTFSPSTQAATVNGANVSGINFTTSVQNGATYSISGTVSPTAGGSGATVMLSGAAGATTVTNTSGNYIFTGLANGTYTVTPTDTGYTFSPVNQNVTIIGTNLANVNFTATAQPTPQRAHSVALSWNASSSIVSGYNVYRSTVSGTGYTKLNSSLDLALAYTDSTVQNGTTYYYVTTAQDSSGNESLYSNEIQAIIP